MSSEDELRSLARLDPPSALVSRVRRVVGVELGAKRGPRWHAGALRWWTRVAVPAIIAFTVVGYLHWAFRAASALYR